MAYSVLPIAGVDLNTTTPISFSYTNGTTAVSIPDFAPLGTQTFGMMAFVMCLHKQVQQLRHQPLPV